jgi:hypothetical protein
LRTVFSLSVKRVAISWLEAPRAMRSRISRSRWVSSGNGSSGGRRAEEPPEPVGDARAEDGLAGSDGLDRVQDLALAGLLEDVSAGTRAQRGEDEVVVAEHAEDQHVRVGALLGDARGRLDPVDPGHAHVHQHDVGLRRAHQLDGLLAVRGRAHELGDVGVGDRVAQPVTEHGMVVDDENADHGGRGRVASTRVPDRSPVSSRRLPPSSPARARIESIPTPAV